MSPRSVRIAALAGAAALAIFLAQRLRVATAPPPPPPLPPQDEATVAVYDEGKPLAGRWVVFHAADGRVLSVTRSSAEGTATGPAGGMITVAYGSSVRHLVTVAGVARGDLVVVGEREDDEAEGGHTAAVARVTLPGPFPAAARYSVDLGLGPTAIADAAAPLRLPVLRRFVEPDGRFRVLGVALDSDAGPLAYSFTRAEARDGGAEVALPAWVTSFRTQRIALARAPEDLTGATADLAIVDGAAVFHQRAAARGGEITFSVAPPLGRTATFRVELARGLDRAVLVRRAALPPEVRLDLAKELLPRVSSVSVAARSHLNLARPVLRWRVEGGDTSAADALVLRASWPETKEHVWTVLAPPATKAPFELPALPDELSAWRPGSAPLTAGAALVEASAWTGYEDVKRSWLHLLTEALEREGAVRLSIAGDLDF